MGPECVQSDIYSIGEIVAAARNRSDVQLFCFIFPPGLWGSRVSWIPASSHWTCGCVSATVLDFSQLYFWNTFPISFCVEQHLSSASGWRPTPATPAWTSTTSRQLKTWQALLSAALPPPSRSPTCPPLASGARGPNTSWSWRVSKTTTTHWRAHCERLQTECVFVSLFCVCIREDVM